MSIKICLNESEIKELDERLSTERDTKIWKRLKCIKLKNEGSPNKEIARMFDVCVDTITDWLRKFKDEGFEGLCKLRYDGRRTSQLDPHKDEIIEIVTTTNISNLEQLRDIIQTKFHLSVSRSLLSLYLRKLNLSYKKNEVGSRR